LSQKFCHSAATFRRERPSRYSSGYGLLLHFCLCSWSIPGNGITFLSVWYASCMDPSEGMVSWSEMSCAHGLAIRVYGACLLRPWLMWLSFIPLSQRAWYEFLLLSLWLWQGMCPVLLPLHSSEDSACLPVSFPEGMVLCKPGRELRMSPCHFRRSMDVMLSPWRCMGCKAHPWGRAGLVSDANDVCFCLTPVSPACSIYVLVSAAWVLESRDWYHCSCMCLWCVLCCAWRRCWLLAGSLLRRAGMLHLVRLLG